jgi:tetratricopeptide (TPR) repeat protein
LARNFGDSPEVIASQKNARVAQSKRAYFAEQLGRHAESAEALEKLLAAFPKDRDYLQRAALAHFHRGNFEKSLKYWSTLIRGLTAGEDDWCQAKYHQIACLAETDKAAGAKVFKQFKLLYPELGGDAWRAKFERLGRQFE